MDWKNRAVWSGLGALALGVPQAEAGIWRSHRDHVLGTSLDMVAVASHPDAPHAAFVAVEAEIARLDGILSGWRTDSELAALNASAVHDASQDLFAVVAACESWRRLTGGAFCARLGTLEWRWHDAALEYAPSLAAVIAAADVRLDAGTRRIVRPEAVRFAPDSLAKGYIIDRALDAARGITGLDGLLIDIGGDLRAWGTPPHPAGWRVAVMNPKAPFDNARPMLQLHLGEKGIATSGGGARDITAGGRTVSHLLWPATGVPLSSPNQATVIADRAADADALATALAVLPPEDGVRLVDRVPGAAAWIGDAKGTAWRSTRWADYQPTAAVCQAAAPAASLWPPDFALTVSYEIPRFEASNYRAPYVVIWVSDEQRRLVRTLLVLGDSARWRESNYVWWRRFERFTPDTVQAVSRPTRAPGRYDLIWDGRDDQGNPVRPGRYTLNIEAAREYGTHSLQAIDLDLGDAPAVFQAPAQAEIGTAQVHYGPRS